MIIEYKGFRIYDLALGLALAFMGGLGVYSFTRLFPELFSGGATFWFTVTGTLLGPRLIPMIENFILRNGGKVIRY